MNSVSCSTRSRLNIFSLPDIFNNLFFQEGWKSILNPQCQIYNNTQKPDDISRWGLNFFIKLIIIINLNFGFLRQISLCSSGYF